mgnify:CR=1 FL=1
MGEETKTLEATGQPVHPPPMPDDTMFQCKTPGAPHSGVTQTYLSTDPPQGTNPGNMRADKRYINEDGKFRLKLTVHMYSLP